MNVIVKICGLSTPETVDAALRAGADMVGLNFFPPSPRYVSLELAAQLAALARGRGEVATVTVDMAGVRDNAYQAFEFAPLPLPAGVPAYFCLEAPAASPGNAVTVGARQIDAYAGGQAQSGDGRELAGVQDLSFLLFYKPAPSWAVATGLQRLAADKPGWFGVPLFYAAVFAAYLVLLAGLAWGLGGRLVRPVAVAAVENSVEPAAEAAAGEPAACASRPSNSHPSRTCHADTCQEAPGDRHTQAAGGG